MNLLQSLTGEGGRLLGCSVLLACEFVILAMLIRLLWVFQKEIREIRENRRLYHEYKREILKLDGVFLQPEAGPLGRLGKENLNGNPRKVVLRSMCANRNNMEKLLNVAWVCLRANPLTRFFLCSARNLFGCGTHKPANVRDEQQPPGD